MKNMVITLSSLTLVILIGIFLYFTHSSWQPFHCSTHFVLHFMSKEGEKFELNLDVNVVTPNENSVEFIAAGSLNGPDSSYVVHRRIFTTLEKSNVKGFYKSKIIKEIRYPVDNLPDSIWREYVLPEVPDIAFYVRTKKLRNNLYLITGLTTHHFTCAAE